MGFGLSSINRPESVKRPRATSRSSSLYTTPTPTRRAPRSPSVHCPLKLSTLTMLLISASIRAFSGSSAFAYSSASLANAPDVTSPPGRAAFGPTAGRTSRPVASARPRAGLRSPAVKDVPSAFSHFWSWRSLGYEPRPGYLRVLRTLAPSSGTRIRASRSAWSDGVFVLPMLSATAPAPELTPCRFAANHSCSK